MILYQWADVVVDDKPEWRVEIWLNKHSWWIVANNEGYRAPMDNQSFATLQDAQAHARELARRYHHKRGERCKVRWIV